MSKIYEYQIYLWHCNEESSEKWDKKYWFNKFNILNARDQVCYNSIEHTTKW